MNKTNFPNRCLRSGDVLSQGALETRVVTSVHKPGQSQRLPPRFWHASVNPTGVTMLAAVPDNWNVLVAIGIGKASEVRDIQRSVTRLLENYHDEGSERHNLTYRATRLDTKYCLYRRDMILSRWTKGMHEGAMESDGVC